MKKLKQLKEAVKNPPPERLARIEYRSHFLQMLGITAVCTILFAKGFWYIIFAFVFGVGISYSQGITAYKKYKMISSLVEKEKPKDFEKDISFTRRRGKIIKDILGRKASLFSIIISVMLPLFIIDPLSVRWFYNIAYFLMIIFFYVFIYYYICYWIAYPFYKRKLKGGKEKNAKRKRRS